MRTPSLLLATVLVALPTTTLAHEPEDLAVCQGEDDVGPYVFPVGQTPSLLALCNELGGVLGIVDAPPAVELVAWMTDWGLYDPGYVLNDEWLWQLLPSPSPAPTDPGE